MYKLNPDDICEWSDGTWCYVCELHEMTHMSNDYTVMVFDEKRHQ